MLAELLQFQLAHPSPQLTHLLQLMPMVSKKQHQLTLKLLYLLLPALLSFTSGNLKKKVAQALLLLIQLEVQTELSSM